MGFGVGLLALCLEENNTKEEQELSSSSFLKGI
jgi:hypothetical protein